MATLKIIDRGDVPADKLNGSWAGAFGQTQFMPSTFLRLAVDFEGDGRRDIVDSAPDALASTANYLRKSGWRPGLAWGFEVKLPDGYSGPSGRKAKQSMSFWAARGVTRIDGRPLGSGEAALLLPAGRDGPAFLVTRNFDAVYSYNAAESYTLAACVLADRLAGGRGIVTPWPTDDPLLPLEGRKEVQALLARRGYDVGGAPDGDIGTKSKAAIADFESRAGHAGQRPRLGQGARGAEAVGRHSLSQTSPKNRPPHAPSFAWGARFGSPDDGPTLSETICAEASHPRPHRRRPASRRPVSPAPAQASSPGPTFSPSACRTARSSKSATSATGRRKSALARRRYSAPGFEPAGMDSPFAALDRMSAEMDREAQALLNETARLQASAFGFPDAFAAVDSGRLAPGSRSFSVVSTLSGGHMCSRSVEVFASPDGGRPRVVTRTSGDCGPGHRGSPSPGARRPAEPARMRPGLIEVNATPGEILAPQAASERIAVR